MIQKIATLTSILLVLCGMVNAQYCTNNARYTEQAFFDTSEITIGANIQYGSALDHLGNPVTLRMDLYYPSLVKDNSPKRPFVMLFHGGGFSSGDKQSGDIRDLCFLLAMRGFVCASVNYRLGYDFSEYGQYKARYRAIQDGKAALRYCVSNAATIRIDTNWMFVGGQSAGSLLALGMVYANQFELDSVSLLYNATAVSVELGNLNSSGNNLTNAFSIKGVFNNWGAVTKSEMDLSEMIPTIAFHGQGDSVVQIGSDSSFAHYTLDGSKAIHNTLLANGICSELSVVNTNEHGIYRNQSAVFRAQRASCFFKRIFCNTCTSLYTTDSIPSNCSLVLGVNEGILGSNIQIFPNPFTSSFNLKGVNGTVHVSIYNTMGQLLFKEYIDNGNVQVDLLAGVYLITIKETTSGKTYTTKLIKN